MMDNKIKEYVGELLDTAYLQKWPQMLVWGRPIEPERAMEIIRRTDTFFTLGYGGNDSRWESEVFRLIGRPVIDYRADAMDWQAYHRAQDEFNRRWQTVSTEYVHNSWVATAYIGGPNGWCHPDGTIYNTTNVGKWPDGVDLYVDWVKLAKAFPFLDLTAAFMSGESCENGTGPLLVFHVREGTVHVVPVSENPFERFGVTVQELQRGQPSIEDQVKRLSLPTASRERHFGIEQIQQWADRMNGVV